MPATNVTTQRTVASVGGWQLATVDAVTVETYRAKTVRVSLPGWRTFRAGQHVDVRLTAPDGYQAQRSYSIASAPELTGAIELTIELVDDGEVSSWFHEVVEPGDTFEVRGPIGGPFTWSVDQGGPILLVAGGSGVVPLMSMLRHRAERPGEVAALLLYSSRTIDDVIYRDELDSLAAAQERLDVVHTLTRTQPGGWTGFDRRIDEDMIGNVLGRIDDPRHVFVCGPTSFVEGAAAALVRCDVDADRIRTERFGPSASPKGES